MIQTQFMALAKIAGVHSQNNLIGMGFNPFQLINGCIRNFISWDVLMPFPIDETIQQYLFHGKVWIPISIH
jgi:hypothetical protein